MLLRRRTKNNFLFVFKWKIYLRSDNWKQFLEQIAKKNVLCTHPHAPPVTHLIYPSPHAHPLHLTLRNPTSPQPHCPLAANPVKLTCHPCELLLQLASGNMCVCVCERERERERENHTITVLLCEFFMTAKNICSRDQVSEIIFSMFSKNCFTNMPNMYFVQGTNS